MSFDPHAIAKALGGYVQKGRAYVPAPGHTKVDRSAVLTGAPNLRLGFHVHLFSPGDPLAAKEEFGRVLRPLGLVPLEQGGSRRCSSLRKAIPSTATRQALTPEDLKRVEPALSIWAEAMSPEGTPVERYLARRGLSLPPAADEVLRFHPRCPFGKGRRVPAMVALVRDIRDNYPRGIHRTALASGGHKVEVDGLDRRSMGPIGGGAIKLTPDEDLGSCLGVGEGIESALSLQHLPEFGTSAVWSLISAGGIAKLPVLPGIDGLWIAVDHDAAGLAAARECANRWRKIETTLIQTHEPKTDLNDLLKDPPDAA